MDVTLNTEEVACLFRQDPETKRDGGFQGLLVGLQEKCDRTTGALSLSTQDINRIRKYAVEIGRGGWEDRLKAIFSRHLGADLSGLPENN